jgi:polyhydroxyalkanoate synthesis regulator phasin
LCRSRASSSKEFCRCIACAKGNVAKRVPEILEDASNERPTPFRHLIDRLTEHLKELDRQVKQFEREIVAWHRSSELRVIQHAGMTSA